MSQIISDIHRVARKSHACSDCRRTIDPGETYRYATILGDCGIFHHKRCAHCDAFMAMYGSLIDYDNEGISWWDIDEWEPETAAAIEHKSQWRTQWRVDADSLYPVPQKPSR